jgi:hypothetical protein
MQEFKLVPFPSNITPNIKITGEIMRVGNKISLRYEVNGDIDRVLLSSKAPSSSRTDDLWKATCFEFFIAIPDQPHYWEFNLSPSGDWNVYVMEAYRRVGFREEVVFTQLPFVFRKSQDKLSLDISLDLSPILQPKQVVQVGIASIIQTTDQTETYWALAHPGPQADFHLRESFTISL